MDRLNKRDENIVGTEQEKLDFLSLIMSIMWGAKRTQQCTLFNVTSLASLSKYGTKDDFDDGLFLLQYINKNRNEYVKLKIVGKVQLSVFVDSSSNLYKDARGHGGYVITIGDTYGGPIDSCSAKSKLNGRSSMEYELFALHGMLPNLLFLYDLLNELGYKQAPVTIFEDNKALIDLIKRGKVSSGVTKHINAKYYYAKDLISRGIVKFQYCPTEWMIADVFTKPLTKARFKKLRDMLHNHCDDESIREVYRKLYNGELINDKDKRIRKIVVNALELLHKELFHQFGQ